MDMTTIVIIVFAAIPAALLGAYVNSVLTAEYARRMKSKTADTPLDNWRRIGRFAKDAVRASIPVVPVMLGFSCFLLAFWGDRVDFPTTWMEKALLAIVGTGFLALSFETQQIPETRLTIRRCLADLNRLSQRIEKHERHIRNIESRLGLVDDEYDEIEWE